MPCPSAPAQANPDPVRRAAGSAQASVRQRADKVLRLIGDETLPREGTAPAAATQGKFGNSWQLLGWGRGCWQRFALWSPWLIW